MTDSKPMEGLGPSEVFLIEIKTNDGGVIRYEENFVGALDEAKRRAWILWARTSFVVGDKANRDVYACLKLWTGNRWFTVKEKRGKYPAGRPAPAQT